MHKLKSLHILHSNQGDMLLTPSQVKLLNATGSLKTRGIASKLAKLWTLPAPGDDGGKIGIPYKIDSRFSPEQQGKILEGLADIEENTCIRYVF